MPDSIDVARSDLRGFHTLREILSQAESWRGALDAVEATHGLQVLFDDLDRVVLFVGCGSPYFLGVTAAAVFQAATGRPALAMPGSEVLFNYDAGVPAGPPPLVVVVSRTGETTELLEACRTLRNKGSRIVAITVSERSSLDELADVIVRIRGADEVSLAQTRSFTAMLVATLAVTARSAAMRRDLSELPARLPAYLEHVRRELEGLSAGPYARVAFLGSGARFGLAREAAMKMTEMSLTDATAYHVLEYRHGPQAMADDGTLVVGLLDRFDDADEQAVLEEVALLGSTVVAIAAGSPPTRRERWCSIPISDDLSAAARLPFYLPPVQLLAFRQAGMKRLDPDRPRNLSRFVDLSSRPLAASDRTAPDDIHDAPIAPRATVPADREDIQ